MSRGRMIVVSNRLPVTIGCSDGRTDAYPSAGGLVTALAPILRKAGGCWVGWTGGGYEPRLQGLLNNWTSTHNYSLHPVFISPAEKDGFYNGCSNQIIWPLFHGLPSLCRFDSEYWRSYRTANEKFAQAAQTVWRTGDAIWVQDYHLMLVAQFLRRRGFCSRIAYFHHIPFPTPDLFETLPWRAELLFGLMHYDVIGFQTARDVRNFSACVRLFLPEARMLQEGGRVIVKTHDFTVMVGDYPISIDFDEFAADSDTAAIETTASIAAATAGGKTVLGVDRLDYTKGIVQRLSGFKRLLEEREEWRGRVTLFQIVIPSREAIPEYRQLKVEIETRISEINGQYGRPDWVPVRYFYRSVPREELLGFYRSADVALVTPLRDGMNLVAKEFCAARNDNRGVLVLSEFAGAADELGPGALLVNPNDAEAIASALHNALTMEESEQAERMATMRLVVRTRDVFQWASRFAQDASGVAAESAAVALRAAGD